MQLRSIWLAHGLTRGGYTRFHTLKDFEVLDVRVLSIDVEFHPVHGDINY